MLEDHKEYCVGKVKVVLARHGETDEWEAIHIDFWHDDFTYNSKLIGKESWVRETLRDMYLMGEDYTEALKDHSKNEGLQVFELIGDLHHESWKSWTDCGYEYDAREWLENTRVREIKGEDLEWFKEEDPFRWKDFWGEEVVDA